MNYPLNALLFYLSGAALPFAFAPIAFWPLVIISPLIWLVLVDTYKKSNQNVTQFIHLNFFYWLGFYSFGVSWVYVSINEYGYTPAPIAALLALIFAGGLSLVNCIHAYVYFKFDLHKTYLLSFPASWVILEWLRSWLLTGFPWLYSGYAFVDSPFSALASLGGVFSLSFLAIFIASLLFYIYKNFNRNRWLSLSAIFSILLWLPLSDWASSQNWISINTSSGLKVHLVQGNIPQHEKWLPENQRKILLIYNDLVQKTFDDIAAELQTHPTSEHLIVLPEAAMPTLQSQLSWLFDRFDEQAKTLNTGLVSGIFYDENEEGFNAENIYNSIIGVGLGNGLYHKQRLVPFGEYVPLEDLIRGLIPFFDLPYSSFAKGQYGQTGLTFGNATIAPFICYEILYPELVYAHAKDTDYLLTISNDAWFGNSWGPKQHFQMARMRAIEHGKFLIRATNTGTTAIVDPFGKVIAQADRETRTVLSGSIYLTEGKTPFEKLGHLPVLLISAFLLFACCCLKFYKTQDP